MLMIGGGSSDCSMVRELYSSSTIGECYWGLCSSVQAHLLGHSFCTYTFALFYKPWQNNHSSNSWMTGDFVYLDEYLFDTFTIVCTLPWEALMIDYLLVQ